MTDAISNTRSGCLIIGYGSLLRSDDGAGYLLASELDQLAIDGLSCKAVHQLTPDLAADMANAAEVYFIDAFPATAENEALRIVALSHLPLHDQQLADDFATHHSSPRQLLKLCHHLYHTQPAATMIGIPGYDFSLGEIISPMTRLIMNEAKQWLTERLQIHA